MKIRNGFVTNSSSSSFVIAFKNQEDYDRFKSYCIDMNYTDVEKLIRNMLKYNKKTLKKKEIKEKAIEILKYSFVRDKIDEMLDKFRQNYKNEHENLGHDYFVKEAEYRHSKEYEKEIEDFLVNNEKYQEKLKEINEVEILCVGTIWDSEGGLLEYAIRNGLLRQEFRPWLIANYEVG